MTKGWGWTAAAAAGLVLAVAAGAMWAPASGGATKGAVPQQATATATGLPAGWLAVDLGRFSLQLPPGWRYEERQGIDSFVGAFVGDGVELAFDYGRYSNSLPEAGTPGYEVTHETIGGKAAKLVVAKDPPANLTGVHFGEADVVRLGCDRRVVDLLTVYGLSLTPEQQAVAVAVFRTIRFPGPGTWTVVEPPSAPGTRLVELRDVEMLSADEGWAVGSQERPGGAREAAILHYAGGTWTALASPAEDALTAVDMVSSDEGWAVGGSTVLHYANGSWTVAMDDAPGPLQDIQMLSADDGWAAGGGGMLRLQGGAWAAVDPLTGAVDVDMVSPAHGWAAGDGDVELYRFGAGGWQEETWPEPSLSVPRALSMRSQNWATSWIGGGGDGEEGWLLRRCDQAGQVGHEVARRDLPGPVRDIEMLDDLGTDGWAAGGGSGDAWLAHFDDDVWTVAETPFSGTVHAIGMASERVGWAAGTRTDGETQGVLLRYDAPQSPAQATATPTPSPSPTDPCAMNPPPTPEPLWVEPVTSPTSLLTQTITVYLGRGREVTVGSVAGSVTVTGTADDFDPGQVTIPLLPNTTHELTVSGRVEYYPGCFYRLTTTRDRHGQPLVIVQAMGGSVFLPDLRRR